MDQLLTTTLIISSRLRSYGFTTSTRVKFLVMVTISDAIVKDLDMITVRFHCLAKSYFFRACCLTVILGLPPLHRSFERCIHRTSHTSLTLSTASQHHCYLRSKHPPRSLRPRRISHQAGGLSAVHCSRGGWRRLPAGRSSLAVPSLLHCQQRKGKRQVHRLLRPRRDL